MKLKKYDVVVCGWSDGSLRDYFIITCDCAAICGKYYYQTRNAFGWDVKQNITFHNSGQTKMFDRKATEEEKEWFYKWIRANGHYVNLNTLNYY